MLSVRRPGFLRVSSAGVHTTVGGGVTIALAVALAEGGADPVDVAVAVGAVLAVPVGAVVGVPVGPVVGVAAGVVVGPPVGVAAGVVHAAIVRLAMARKVRTRRIDI